MHYSKSLWILLLLSSLIGITSKAQTPVRNEQGYVLIDYDGEILTNTTYDYISKSSSRYFIAVKNGLWGYLNNNGEVSIPLQYDVAYPFNGEFALVGKNGTYYQINKQDKKLNTLDWAQAPIVYNKQYLIANNKDVYYKDGSIVYESKHHLINATKSGIIEWKNNSDTLSQYISRNGRKNLIKIKNYHELDTLFITQQGYLGLVKTVKNKKNYSVYNKRAEQLVKMPAEGVHPNYIRLVWGSYVYWPNGNANYPENIYGQEVHYPMQYLSPLRSNYKTGYGFQLSEKYHNDKMVLLPQTEKWIQFNGRYVTGKRIFDGIAPGDKTYTPVKIERDWYILNRREDTLGSTPFKHIHPLGMNKGRFFASTQNPGSSEEKWAFVNLKEGIITDEIFGIPVIPRNKSRLFEDTVIYDWNNDLNEVIKDGRKTFIDNQGKIIWMNPTSKPIIPQDYFKTEIKISARKYSNLPKKNKFKRNQLSINISPSKNGVKTTIANTSKTDIPITIQDGNFQTKLEYKNEKNEWIIIAYLDPSWCGNSYYPIKFPAKKMITNLVKIPKGSTEMLVRMVLEVNNTTTLTSNEITINTNSGRMKIPEYYKDFGLTYRKQ